MKKKFAITSLLFITLILSSIGLRFAQGAAFPVNILTNTSNASKAPWTIETIESANDTGLAVSVAIDPEDGTIYVSYYDSTNDDLRSAKYVGSGGNCGVGNSWVCRTLDQNADVGKDSSIAVNPQSVNVGIAYRGDGDLKYATGCYAPACLWSYSTIDAGYTYPQVVYKGYSPSLVFHSDGTPVITYQTSENHLMVAQYTGSNGDCGEGTAAGKWQCDSVNTGYLITKYPSLALDSEEDWHITYYNPANDSLMYTYWSGGNQVDLEILSPQAGKYPSIAIDINNGDVQHIAHYDETNHSLEYAKYVGSGGNCGYFFNSYTWQCDEIDDMGPDPASPKGLDIAVDNAGYPIIAYGANYTLKIARPVAALGSRISGNCGPMNPTHTWKCETIDIARNSGQSGQANYASIAVNSAGLATIAYYGDFSTTTNDDGDLKVAYQRLHLYLPLITKK